MGSLICTIGGAVDPADVVLRSLIENSSCHTAVQPARPSTSFSLLYATLLPFPPVWSTSAPDAAACCPSGEDKYASKTAESAPLSRFPEAAVVAEATRLGSAWPITGTAVASTVWNGNAMKWPAESNHSVKERLISTVEVGVLLPFGVVVMVML